VDVKNYAAILCCTEDMLYHIWGDKVEAAPLAPGTDIKFVVKGSTTQVKDGNYWLSCPMKWLNGELISSLHDGREYRGLFRFNPSRLEFLQVAAFDY
jgi:hypothetical protein